MNVIIPAAGQGTRLRPLTDSYPKCLIEVNRRPLLYYLLSNLKKLNVEQVFIIIGYRQEMIVDYIENNSGFPPITFIRNDRHESTNNIVSLWMSKEFWNEDFCIIESDLLIRFDLLEQLVTSKDSCLFIDNSKNFDGIDMKAKIENHHLVYLDKNLSKSETSGEFFGFSRWTPEFAEQFLTEIELFINKNETTVLYDFAIRRLAQKIDLPVRYCSADSWFEIDNMDDYLKADSFLADNFKAYQEL